MQSLMQSLKSRLLNEAKVGGTVQPADKEELRTIIKERLSLLDKYEVEQILDLEDIDTSKITDMSYLFRDLGYNAIPSWTIIRVSNWDTSNVEDMSYLFPKGGSCSISDLSKWDTRKVKDMSYMFYFTQLADPLTGLSKWDTSNVVNMEGMFRECTGSKLKNDISNWDVSNVENMKMMFYKSKDIKCDLSKWELNPDCQLDNLMFQGSRMKEPEWYTPNAKTKLKKGENWFFKDMDKDTKRRLGII